MQQQILQDTHIQHGVVSVPCIIYGLIWLLMLCRLWELSGLISLEHPPCSSCRTQKSCTAAVFLWGRNALNSSRIRGKIRNIRKHSTSDQPGPAWPKSGGNSSASRDCLTAEKISFVHQRPDPLRIPRDRWWDWDLRDGLCGFVLLWQLLRCAQAPELL